MGKKIKQKNRECASNLTPRTNALIKLPAGGAPPRSPGVKGAGSPLAQNLSKSQNLSTHPPPHSTRVKPVRV